MAHTDPPGLPDVVDEAGETPRWVPLLGVGLLLLVGVWILIAKATGGDDTPAARAAEAAARERTGAAAEPLE